MSGAGNLAARLWAALAKDCAIFNPYVDLVVHPVLEMEEGSAVLQAGIDYNER